MFISAEEGSQPVGVSRGVVGSFCISDSTLCPSALMQERGGKVAALGCWASGKSSCKQTDQFYGYSIYWAGKLHYLK